MKSKTPRLNRRTFVRNVGIAGGLGMLAAPHVRAQSSPIVLRYASLFAADHPESRGADHFAELVAAKTGGKVKIQVFYNAALGSTEEIGPAIRSGTVDIGYCGLPGLTFIPELAALEMPYLFENLDEMQTVADKLSPILRQLMTAHGLQNLGYQFDGPRVTLSTVPLHSLADFKGLRFRVPQSPLYIAMVKAFGAIPTPVALPEVYMALQAHVAQAIEGSASTLYTGKYYEVAKNLIRTDHIFYITYVIMNAAKFGNLPPDIRQALTAAATESAPFDLELSRQANRDDLDRLVKAGVTVITPDKAPFRLAVQDVNEKFAAGLGGRAMELYHTVRQVTGR